MAEARLFPFAMGRAALFSARAPDKDGPNEDGAGTFPVDPWSGVLAVADGLGGQSGGATASRLTLESIGDAIEAVQGNGGSIRAAILDGVERANERVLELGIGAATTLAAIEITGDALRPYHIGDSEILVVGQRGRIKLQTVSHAPVAYAVEAGMLDEHEALHHDDRHLVSNIVGVEDMRIEVGSPLKLAPRDTALIGTDGLFDNLKLDEIVELIRTKPLERVSRELVARCHERMCRPADGKPSKPDDLTFVLFRPGPR